jgi:hypothetical protein
MSKDFQDTIPMPAEIKLIDTTPPRRLAEWVTPRRAKEFDEFERRRLRDRNDFKRDVFLAVLPAAMNNTWTVNGKAVRTLSDRIQFAWRTAARAVDLES